MTQTVTIELPDKLYRQLQRAAELSGKPIHMLVEQSVRYTVPPLVEDIPEEYQSNVYPLLEMTVEMLKVEAAQVFPAVQSERYQDLLDLRRERSLTAPEEAEFAALRKEADILSLRKAYAAVLLKRQGYSTPNQQPAD